MGRSQNRIAYYRDRCTPPLSQAGLAAALALHINTVQRWERDGVPGALELLRLTQFFVAQGAIADEAAARAFWASGGRDGLDVPPEFASVVVEALASVVVARMPTDALPDLAPPPCFLVPLRPNPLFVGRECELLALAALVKGAPEDVHAAVVAVTGVGGVGKTQLAVAFAHHYGAFFPGGVFWFNCADPAALPEAVAASGGPGALDLRPDYERLSLPTRVRLVQAAWRAPTPRLLIFDNCEDEALLQTWLPPAGGCRALITSRRAQWDATLGVQTLALHGLTRAASQALLRRHRPDLADAEPALDALAATLGDLPLALHLAGRFLAREGISPQIYLAQFQQAPSVLQHPSMQQGGVSPTLHTQRLDHTIALSVGRLDPATPADRLTLAMLARAARCAPGASLPRSLLFALMGEDDQREAVEAYAAAALERAAGDLGLLERSGEVEGEAAFRLHPLIAAFMQAHSDNSDAQAAAECGLLHAIGQQFAENQLPSPLLLEHLQYLAAAALPRRDAAAAHLASTLGWQLLQRTHLEEAQHYLEQAHAINAAVFGPSHPETAGALNLLALHWDFRNEHRRAHPLYERALAIFEQTLGAEHLDTSTCCNNLGLSLCNAGDYRVAHTYLLRALAAREAQDPNSADTARTLNNLGQLLTYLESWDEAQQAFTRALAIREHILPAVHPSTAQTLNNLGVVSYEWGDYAAARHYHARAHAMRVAVFGPEHNDVAESLYNLGRVAVAEGDYQRAEALLQQALAINTRLFEPAHVEIASHQVALAQVFGATGRAENARALLEQVLIGLEAHYGENHLEVANALVVLAPILDMLGDTAGAAAAWSQAGAIQTTRHQRQNTRALSQGDVLPTLAAE